MRYNVRRRMFDQLRPSPVDLSVFEQDRRKPVPPYVLGTSLPVVDATGRLLGERQAANLIYSNRSERDARYPLVEVPYQDSRKGDRSRMNQEALVQMSGKDQEAAILAEYAGLAEQTSLYVRDPSTLEGLHRLSGMMVQMPTYLTMRARSPLSRDGDISPSLANAYKVARGLHAVTISMLDARMSRHQHVTGQQIYDFANAHHELTRPSTGEVCAAPPKMITRMSEQILHIEKSRQNGSQLSQVLGSGDRQIGNYTDLIDLIVHEIGVTQEVFRQRPALATGRQLADLSNRKQSEANEILGRQKSKGTATPAEVIYHVTHAHTYYQANAPQAGRLFG